MKNRIFAAICMPAASLVAFASSSARAQTAATPTVSPAATSAPTQTAKPSPTPTPIPPHWTGSAALGYSTTSGNTTSSSFSTAIHAVHVGISDKLSTYINLLQSYGNGAVTANQGAGGFRYDWSLSPKLFSFISADWNHDQLQYLTFGQLYGLGLGKHVVNTKTRTFDVLAGFGYSDNRYASYVSGTQAIPATSFTAPTAVLGETFTTALSPTVNVTESIFYHPRLNGSGQTVTNMNLGLTAAISKCFTLNVGATDQYTSEIVPPVKPNNLLISTGLGYKFGS